MQKCELWWTTEFVRLCREQHFDPVVHSGRVGMHYCWQQSYWPRESLDLKHNFAQWAPWFKTGTEWQIFWAGPQGPSWRDHIANHINNGAELLPNEPRPDSHWYSMRTAALQASKSKGVTWHSWTGIRPCRVCEGKLQTQDLLPLSLFMSH